MNSKNLKYIVFSFFLILFLGCIATQFVTGDDGNNEENNSPNNNANNPNTSGEVYNYTPYQNFWLGVYEQNASDWGYEEWRHYIILETYGVTEIELADEIKNDTLFENNIHIFTILVWGIYNGSLNEEDTNSLKAQLIHDTVNVKTISFLRKDEVNLTLNIEIAVKSTPSMTYVAERLKLYLKSENSSGKWYSDTEDHYVEVYSKLFEPELEDLNPWDNNYAFYWSGPINLETYVAENNLEIKAEVVFYLNNIIYDVASKIENFDILDDDHTPPDISYVYTGDYTDGNSGELLVSALDSSGLILDPSGIYTVPNNIGLHNFTFIAIDADDDRPDDSLNSTLIVRINITDDDTTQPTIHTYYNNGDGTDGNPGCFSWQIIDSDDGVGGDYDSGLSIINITVSFNSSNDGIPGEEFNLSPIENGTWYLPAYLGKYTLNIITKDNDDDRTLIIDSLSAEVEREQDLVDDDIIPPEINYIYTGDGIDGNPGEIIVSASDFSGLSIDPSGPYSVPSSLGTHIFIFNATDADNDRPGDALNSTITVVINITDDDITPPEINYVYTGDGTDGNSGNIIITASDISGLLEDPSGAYTIPNSLGTYVFIFNASDADNDRSDDSLNSTITVVINITDDDIKPPKISYVYTGDGTDGNPGEIIVSASDISGLLEDPSGTYTIPNSLGTYVFIFNATDADDDRSGDSLNSSITVVINVTDDDITPPEISYIYTGDGTDGNPGEIIVTASDISGFTFDPSGAYSVPNSLGTYVFIFNATDADNDRSGDSLNSSISIVINITDDDITPPEINYVYTGDGTDGNPGEIIVSASDASGLFEDPSGNYTVPNNLGTYIFILNASDADNDRSGDSLNFTITVVINITDDDITPPEISYIYTGDGTDGNPGELIVSASDISGLFEDPSGNYTVPNSLGTYVFIFNATDADSDRSGDSLNSSISIVINITDDDISLPIIEINYKNGDGTDGNPGEIIVLASDASGLLVDPSGVYNVPNDLGLHNFTFTAIDADQDRPDDSLNYTTTIWINITDDDTTPPTNFIKNNVGDGTDGNPGCFSWQITDFDDGIGGDNDTGFSEIIIKVYFESNEDLPDNEYILPSNMNGTWDFPPYPGKYTITIFARDNDDDRTLIVDSLCTELIREINLVDDDTNPPIIQINYTGEDGTDSNPGYFSWQITDFDDGIGGDNDTGLSEIIIKVYFESYEDLPNKEYILPPSENGTWNLPPYPGKYTMTIFARDNDDDRTLIVDSLSTELQNEQTIIDDDMNIPIISSINVLNAPIYDSSENINIEILVEDDSGIAELYIEFLDQKYYDDDDDKCIIILNPNVPGIYEITVVAIDADFDHIGDQLNITVFFSFEITDDDTVAPEISYTYAGEGTDGNPGEIIVTASDISGLSIDPSGVYSVPNNIGTYVFMFNATDADNDWLGDSLNSTITVIINITDDDITPPEISYTYAGEGTDGNPGEIIVSASDVSGLFIDPSGVYSVPSNIGTYVFIFNATDADNDRSGDALNSSISVVINITDDDIIHPEINYIYTGDGTDGNPGEIIVSASDTSGLSIDPSGAYSVPSSLGTYAFIFNATDADFDRSNDSLNSSIVVWINITDDDIDVPVIDGIFYEEYIYDNDVFIPVEINASDYSGIKKITIEFQGEMYGPYIDNNTYYFAMKNPNELGNYTFKVIIEDADDDREKDSLNLTLEYLFKIIDDDNEAPIIKEILVDDPVYNNASFFLVGVNVSDFSGIETVQIIFIESIYNLTEANGIYYTSILMPSEIGNYSLIVMATDADDDRNFDSLSVIETFAIEVAQGTTTEINITIEFLGFSLNRNLGVDISFMISANLEVSTDYSVIIQLINGSILYTYDEFGTINPTVFKLNNYTLIVKLNVSGINYNAKMTIELAEEDVKDLIYRELDIMRRMVVDSSYKDWRGWARLKKLFILFELDIVEFLAQNDLDEIAYIVMLGIKIELTGNVTNEYGDEFFDWCSCPFIKAWIKDEELRQEFLIECNMILWALKLCF